MSREQCQGLYKLVKHLNHERFKKIQVGDEIYIDSCMCGKVTKVNKNSVMYKPYKFGDRTIDRHRNIDRIYWDKSHETDARFQAIIFKTKDECCHQLEYITIDDCEN